MPIDEEMIERYVRYPETLSEATQQEVEAFLTESDLARRVATFYQDYYRELEALKGAKSPSVESFVGDLLDSIQEGASRKSRNSKKSSGLKQ